MGLSWAEAANYAQHAELCHIGFLSGKIRHWGPPFPCFLSVVAFFLIFLMILQRTPNDGDEGTAHVQLWGVWDCHPWAGEDGDRDSPAAWGSATKVQAATRELSVSQDVLLAQTRILKSSWINK